MYMFPLISALMSACLTTHLQHLYYCVHLDLTNLALYNINNTAYYCVHLDLTNLFVVISLTLYNITHCLMKLGVSHFKQLL